MWWIIWICFVNEDWSPHNNPLFVATLISLSSKKHQLLRPTSYCGSPSNQRRNQVHPYGGQAYNLGGQADKLSGQAGNHDNKPNSHDGHADDRCKSGSSGGGGSFIRNGIANAWVKFR